MNFSPSQVIRLYFACEDCFVQNTEGSQEPLNIRSKLYAFRASYNGYLEGRGNLPELRKQFGLLSKALDSYHPMGVISYGGTEVD